MLQFIDQLRINKTCKNRLWLNLRLQIVHKSIFLIRKKKLYFFHHRRDELLHTYARKNLHSLEGVRVD